MKKLFISLLLFSFSTSFLAARQEPENVNEEFNLKVEYDVLKAVLRRAVHNTGCICPLADISTREFTQEQIEQLMHKATAKRENKLMTVLVLAGASIDKDVVLESVIEMLDYAIEFGDLGLIKRLLDAGLPMELELYKRPGISYSKGKYNIVESLNKRHKGCDRLLAIERLCLQKKYDIVELLERYGVHYTINCACLDGDIERVKKIIRENGCWPDIDERIKGTVECIFKGSGTNEQKEALVRLLIESCPTNGICQSYVNQLLSSAFSHGIDLFRVVFAAGIDPNAARKSSNPLYKAVSTGNEQMLHFLIKEGADVNNIKGLFAAPPLHCVKKGEIAKILIEAGANLYKKHRGYSPLQRAAKKGYISVIKELLSAGVNGENLSCERASHAPLNLAARRGHLEVVKLLLEVGAEPNDLLLDDAVSGGYVGIVKHLLTNCRRLDQSVLDDALIRAVANVDVECIRILTTAGADVNKCCLHTEVKAGHAEIVQILLRAGAKVDARDKSSDRTPLLEAVRKKENDLLIQMLLDAGADVNAASKDGDTPLFASMRLKIGEESIRKLVSAGAKVNVSWNKGMTPLHYAVATKEGTEKLVRMLLDAGAKVSCSARDGRTPLHSAVEDRDNGTIVQMLLRVASRSDINAANVYGDTPLHIALKKHSDLQMLGMILKAGSNVNAVDGNGRTPVHIASEGCWGGTDKRMKVVKLLVEAGANLSAKVCFGAAAGKTPLDTAREKRRYDIAKYLEKKMRGSK